MEGPESLRGAWNIRDEQIAKIYERYIRRAEGQQRARLRRPPAQDGRAASRRPSRCASATRSKFQYVMVDEYQDTNRPQYLLIRRLAEIHRNLARGRRPRPVDLQVARRRPAQHPRLRARLPRGHDRQARAELPLDADRSSTPPSAVISQNRNRKDKRLWTDRKGGAKIVYFRGDDELEEADFITRTIKRGAGRGRRRDDRGALPHQRPVARDRRLADARGHPLQDHRRRPLLRAQGNQGRARLPEADHQPARRREPAARDQRAGARRRQGRDGLAAGDRPERRRRPTRRRCSPPGCRRSARRARSGRSSSTRSTTASSPPARPRRCACSAI